MAHDFRYAFRVLLKSPAFSLVAVLALSLGIGANTAIFTIINTVLLRPLPYAAPDRLSLLRCNMAAKGIADMGFAYADFLEVRRQNRSFSSTAAFFSMNANLSGGDRPERISGARATSNLLDVLGVTVQLGRGFQIGDESWGQHRVALLSHEFWRKRYFGRPDALGQTVLLDGVPHRIVGVLPPGLSFPARETAVWTPISYAPKDDWAGRGNHYLNGIGRLRDGVTLDQAKSDVDGIARRLQAQFPENAGIGIDARDYTTTIVGDVRPALWILLGSVGFVLLIACANVANLLLARAAARQREMTLRAALGASAARLVRLNLIESLILSCVGAAAGILLAYWLLDIIRTTAATHLPRIETLAIDWRVLLFTAGVALITSLLFGLFPAIVSRRLDLAAAMKEGSRATGGSHRSRMRGILVAVEVGLSLVLLIGATLLTESLVKLHRVGPGFAADHVLTMLVSLPDKKYEKPASKVDFYNRAIARLRALPGVQVTAASTTVPLGDWGGWGKWMTIAGREAATLGEVPEVNYREVTPDYFRAMHIPLRSGRFFEPSDAAGRAPVALINETLARRYWPNESPIGKQLWAGPPEALVRQLLPSADFRFPRTTIVGVVGDVRQDGVARPPIEELYVPYEQAGEDTAAGLYLIARTTSDPMQLATAAEAAIREIDPDQPVFDIRSMEDRLRDSVSGRRFNLFLLGGFAGLALLLASVGIYGVLSYAVSQRIPEIGVRLALGAEKRDVLTMVMRSGLTMAGAGIIAGLAAAFVLTRVMESLLYEVKSTDPIAFLIAPVALLAVSALACYVPARRATRVDPIHALRYE